MTDSKFSDVLFVSLILSLVFLTAGDPDIIDALVHWIMES